MRAGALDENVRVVIQNLANTLPDDGIGLPGTHRARTFGVDGFLVYLVAVVGRAHPVSHNFAES
jgi:hypothetical protein